MNLLIRMLIVFIRSYFKPRLPLGVLTTRLDLLVLPTDLDINLHMNNGRYLTICDLSRLDLFLRTGLANKIVKDGWSPLIKEHTMIYKKSLKVFQRYTLYLDLTHWDESGFYMKHKFVRVKDDAVVAEGTSIGVIRSKEGVIDSDKLVAILQKERGN